MADETAPSQIPPIPREVYRAAIEASRESHEVGHRIACAVEAAWIRAWRASANRLYLAADVEIVRDGHDHVIGYRVNGMRQWELRAEIGECVECGCCLGCPGGYGHCPCECHDEKLTPDGRALVPMQELTLLRRALRLLIRTVADEPCRLDHHGFCQEHGSAKPCANAEAIKLIREADRG